MLQNATPLRKSAPGPPNSSCLLYCACYGKCIDPQKSRACHRFWKCYKTFTFCSLLTKLQSRAPATRNDIWTLKKCIETPHYFLHFWLWTVLRATIQQRALFRHLNFEKWSEHGVLCAFWLRHVLCATTACTFSTSQLLKVVCTCWLRNVLRATTAYTFSTSQFQKVFRTWCALCILTSKCASRHNGVHFFDISAPRSVPNVRCFGFFTCTRASRHNGVQFFIFHLASWLRTRRFSEPTFRPSGATNHWKNIEFRDFPTFSRICIFFLLTLSLLSASSLPRFSFVHIVGSLTSKLPSIICLPFYMCN